MRSAPAAGAFWIVLLALLLSAAVVRAADYGAELRAEADRRGLAEKHAWLALLHYRVRARGGVQSMAESPSFFLAEDGRTDPHAELHEALTGFVDPERGAQNGQPLRCAFPARYAWLDEQLGFDPERMPDPECPKYDVWRQNLGPTRGVTLVFPEAYMNNPSSMFGHTLLRLDAAEAESEEEIRDLLAYALNFSAETGPDGGVLFAVRGLIGAYEGYFSLTPYYTMVKRYSDWESRDLWEYPLDLTPEQVERLVQHLWELDDVAFRYYFFTDNCSYQLLGLLEAAAPSLELTYLSRSWVIPVDTVRVTMDQAGRGTAHYRPSATTRIRHMAGGVGPEDLRLARELVDGDAELDDPRLLALPDETKAVVLTLAHDYARHEVPKEETRERRRRTLNILIARSKVPTVGEPGAPLVQPEVRPDQGHRTARLQLGSGWRDDDFFSEVRLRPAFHDLLDPLGGYTAGAQIDFLETAFRYYPSRNRLELHELTVLDMVSLSSRDYLFRPISFKFRTGLTSPLVRRDGREQGLRPSHVWHTQGGGGLTVEPRPNVQMYITWESAFDTGGQLDSGYAWGAGGSLGLLTGDENDRYRAHLRAQFMGYFAGDSRPAYSLELSQRVRLSDQTALELRVRADRDFHEGWLSAGLFWKLFF